MAHKSKTNHEGQYPVYIRPWIGSDYIHYYKRRQQHNIIRITALHLLPNNEPALLSPDYTKEESNNVF